MDKESDDIRRKTVKKNVLSVLLYVLCVCLRVNCARAGAYARCVQYAIDELEAGTDRYIFDNIPGED